MYVPTLKFSSETIPYEEFITGYRYGARGPVAVFIVQPDGRVTTTQFLRMADASYIRHVMLFDGTPRQFDRTTRGVVVKLSNKEVLVISNRYLSNQQLDSLLEQLKIPNDVKVKEQIYETSIDMVQNWLDLDPSSSAYSRTKVKKYFDKLPEDIEQKNFREASHRSSKRFADKKWPAFNNMTVDEKGTISFENNNGEWSNLNGPAVEYADGTKYWYVDGKLHRQGGPAIEKANGFKEWWVNNKKHRLDGPATIWPNGRKEWWVNNKRHRLDGPAIEEDGIKEWWVNGRFIGESEKGFTDVDFEQWKKKHNLE
jgi:hypothetical protein